MMSVGNTSNQWVEWRSGASLISRTVAKSAVSVAVHRFAACLQWITSSLAQVEMDSNETDAMVTHFHEKLLQAQEKQEGLGGRARWRKRVRFVFATSGKKRDAENLSLSSRSAGKKQTTAMI